MQHNEHIEGAEHLTNTGIKTNESAKEQVKENEWIKQSDHAKANEPIQQNTHPNERIQKLSKELANQIAAGEVIERPASVLKELLENSLDAGSTQIDIVIERGGIGLIKVQDNGCGIYKEDLELALLQHATSKVSNLTDLEAICSFGFRGEALASIASVSKLKLASCTVNQEMGCIIEKSGREQEVSIKPSPRILGTTIEVRDLFYNTPARRNFLRSERTETTYLEEVFKRIALSHPEVAFSLKLSEKPAKRLHRCLSQEAYARRVAELCGKTFIEHARYLEAESNGLILKGWVGGKEQLRASADLQYFYVNGRIIRDKVINHALRQAYQDSYALGRYPAYILFLELDPASVDVNVHPTKHEVRFREARIIHAFLTYALTESLEPSPSVIPNPTLFDNTVIESPDATVITTPPDASVIARPHTSDIATLHTSDIAMPSDTSVIARPIRAEAIQANQANVTPTNIQPNAQTHIRNSINAKQSEAKQSENSPQAFDNQGNNQDDNQHDKQQYDDKQQEVINQYGNPVALLMGELLILENQQKQEITIVDIKACDEFLISEQLKSEQLKNQPSSKLLLIPCPIKIANKRNLLRMEKILQSFGFQWTESGPNQLLLRAVPNCLETQIDTLEEMFLKILENSEMDESSLCQFIVKVSITERVYTFDMARQIYIAFQKVNTKTSIENSKDKIKIKTYRTLDINKFKKTFF